MSSDTLSAPLILAPHLNLPEADVPDEPVTLTDVVLELRRIRRHLAQRQPEVLAVGLRDLAKMLGVSPATLARWKAAGLLLPGLRKNGRVLYPLDQVRAWVAAGMPDSTTWKSLPH